MHSRVRSTLKSLTYVLQNLSAIVWEPVGRHLSRYRWFRATIWAPGAVPASEWKYRNLKRVALPVLDVVFIVAGISAAHYGVPAISEFFPAHVTIFYSYTLSGAAFACLIGVSFPQFWPLEIIAKSVLIGLLLGYITALFILTRAGEGNRGYVLTIAIASIVLPWWRISILGTEWSDRRGLAEQEKARD